MPTALDAKRWRRDERAGSPPSWHPRRVLQLVRYGLPAVIATVGIALVVLGGGTAQGAGIVHIGVAGLVVLANVFIRLALSSERVRAREAQRRRRL